MCGIYASIGFLPDVKRVDIVSHRGPDGRGWKTFSCNGLEVALGHRRLAIIDLTDQGFQPMTDPSGRFTITFNGEIYNYKELKAELEQFGEEFFTATDTEVLLRAFTRWGKDCLSKLRGMFAFVVWDAKLKVIFAARDRFGIKPLYYVFNEHGVAFASEIKQLLGLKGVSAEANVSRINDFLLLSRSDHTSETMFKNVFQIRGGEFATISLGDRIGRVFVEKWYSIDANINYSGQKDFADQFRRLLSKSVELHLRSDVPIGSCLSGGLDSSSIVCLMRLLLGQDIDINTVSACYDDIRVDERKYISQVNNAVSAKPHYVFPRSQDIFAECERITWHQDEPYGSTSIFAQWKVFQDAKRAGIKVMLDGQGADEQLAGYHFAFPYYTADLLRNGDFHGFLNTIFDRKAIHGAAVGKQLAMTIMPFLSMKMRETIKKSLFQQFSQRWLNVSENSGNFGRSSEKTSYFGGIDYPSSLKSFCFDLTFTSNLPKLLHWEDRNSMAHSIEARVPFLDHPLVEFSLSLDGRSKFRGAETKHVLREAMKGILPEAVRKRQDKIGFGTPEASWFRKEIRPLVFEGVDLTLRQFPGMFDPKETRALTNRAMNGTRNIDERLWRIINLGIWGKVFGVAY